MTFSKISQFPGNSRYYKNKFHPGKLIIRKKLKPIIWDYFLSDDVSNHNRSWLIAFKSTDAILQQMTNELVRPLQQDQLVRTQNHKNPAQNEHSIKRRLVNDRVLNLLFYTTLKCWYLCWNVTLLFCFVVQPLSLHSFLLRRDCTFLFEFCRSAAKSDLCFDRP